MLVTDTNWGWLQKPIGAKALQTDNKILKRAHISPYWKKIIFIN